MFKVDYFKSIKIFNKDHMENHLSCTSLRMLISLEGEMDQR